MPTHIVDGPCPNPACLTLIPYGIGHVDDVRVLEGTCKVCGAYRAYDGTKNVVTIPEGAEK